MSGKLGRWFWQSIGPYNPHFMVGCCDHFGKQMSYCQCNMNSWHDNHIFFMKIALQAWFQMWSHDWRLITPYIEWKLSGNQICSILHKSDSKCDEESIWCSMKIGKRGYILLQEGVHQYYTKDVQTSHLCVTLLHPNKKLQIQYSGVMYVLSCEQYVFVQLLRPHALRP
jgi:hypothetical protein